ncbi:helix-turn-helix domain-containing protein [Algiphilus sp.]|uniref:AlbA family DNA-binding domain-containing protein n=1 Tax=Algiphilus sp. TaxID=1872431 RepID=UPI003B522590
MNVPDWADEVLSKDLPVLRARGESQELEYKRDFPSNTRDLGKEIAAFATSNTGTILVGVDDSGELVGLPECGTSEGRDQMIRRLEGISKGTVKPSITPTAKFAVEGEKVVLVILVPKGAQPVYYSSNSPYIRHLTQACPAEPHEVIERVATHLQASPTPAGNDADDEMSQFYSGLSRVLADILVVTDEADERQFNPWLDMWRSDLGYAASELREMAVLEIAQTEGVESDLRELANALDEVANMRLYLGSGADLKQAVTDVAELATGMMDSYFADAPLADGALNQVRELIRTSALKLQDLYERAGEMVESGRIEELQGQASELARPLTRVCWYNIDPIGTDVRSELKDVARTLHLTETMQLYMDGGASMRAVVDRIKESADKLAELSEKTKL